MPSMTVGQLAGAAGVHVETIRYYQQLGLLELLRLAERPHCRGAREIAARKLSQVEGRMVDLARIRSALRALVRQGDAGPPQSCAIIESLACGAAAKRGKHPKSPTRGRT